MEAGQEATLAVRRHDVVDPTKRPVARGLESRWNTALERLAHLKERIAQHNTAAALRPKIERAALIALARAEQFLVPTLRSADSVMMDNLSSHKGPAIRRERWPAAMVGQSED